MEMMLKLRLLTRSINSINFVVDVQGEEDQQVTEVTAKEAKEDRREYRRIIFKKMKIVIDEEASDLEDKEEEDEV